MEFYILINAKQELVSSFAISVLQIFCKNTNGQTRWNSLTEEEDKCLHNQESWHRVWVEQSPLKV